MPIRLSEVSVIAPIRSKIPPIYDLESTSPESKMVTAKHARRRHQDSSSSPSPSSSACHSYQWYCKDKRKGRALSGRSSYSLFLTFVAVVALAPCITLTFAFKPAQSTSSLNALRELPTRNSNSYVHHHYRHHHHRREENPPTALEAVSKRQVAVLDGAELYSVESFLATENGSTETPPRSGLARLGFLTVVAGTIAEDGKEEDVGQRVVGIQIAGSSNADSDEGGIPLGGGINLYKDSVATIPQGISDTDAIATMMASLSAVHCALPISENVGGSTDVTVSGKAVVVGGGDYATFAADALATLGANVYQISTGKPKPANSKGEPRQG
jgi:hypothetical protein